MGYPKLFGLLTRSYISESLASYDMQLATHTQIPQQLRKKKIIFHSCQFLFLPQKQTKRTKLLQKLSIFVFKNYAVRGTITANVH